MRYSIAAVLGQAFRGQKDWRPQWRDAEPAADYDVVIVGGGGHGLATAYYLAETFGITNVAVLERSHVGSGNIGRNTTIVRSNYLLPGNLPFYEHAMTLWERLEQDINYNAMVSQRGVLNLFHSDAQRDAYAGAATPCGCTASTPSCSTATRSAAASRSSTTTTRASRSWAGCCSGAAAPCGTTRWPGAMRARPSERGVDVVQNCEVTGIRREDGPRRRASTPPAASSAPRRSGSLSRARARELAAMAGMRLPIESHVLQAFVVEGLKPLIDTRRDVRRGAFLHQPVRQGRPRVRRRHRRLQFLRAARQPARRSRT